MKPFARFFTVAAFAVTLSVASLAGTGSAEAFTFFPPWGVSGMDLGSGR